MGMVLITCDEPTEVLQPTDGALDFPAAADATHLATVLGGRLTAILAMSANQLNAPTRQPRSQRITIGGLVVEQSPRLASDHPRRQQRFDECHFIGTSAGNRRSHWQSVSFAVDHDLGPFAAFGL